MRRRRRAQAPRGERGGAVSLWVLLMVPISAFAAVAAMAGPQRLAAKFSTQEAADDLADFAVAWRDLHDRPVGPLPAFPTQCPELDGGQEQDIIRWKGLLDALTLRIDVQRSPAVADVDELEAIHVEIGAVGNDFDRWPDDRRISLPPQPQFDRNADPAALIEALTLQVEQLKALVDDGNDGSVVKQHQTCVLMHDTLVGDLGNLGLDMNSLRGAYSDSLAKAPPQGNDVPPEHRCSDKTSDTQEECKNNGGTWFPVPVLCWTGQQDVVVRDAVYVVLASRWQDGGWAAAQVWPDGLPVAAESVGRLNLRMVPTGLPPCEEYLAVLDEQGRSVWAGDPTHKSRALVQSVPRNSLVKPP